MKAVIYDQDTGAITRVYTGPISMAWLQAGDGEDFLLENDDSTVADHTHYVDVARQEILPRAPLDLTHSINGAVVTLAALPAGTRVSVGTATLETDGDATEIAFDVPGDYCITLRAPVTHLDAQLEVTTHA